MAVLSDPNRVLVWAGYMRRNDEDVALLKTELRAAVNATDQWIDDNASSFNQALPVAARTALTARGKARLLMEVLERRFGVL
jgi:hypothetical protein